MLVARQYSLAAEDGLRNEIKATVKDPGNRAAVYALLQKAKEKSWDVSETLGEDPFVMVEEEMAAVNAGILRLVSNNHPLLNMIAKYYFQIPGKRFRPAVVLLLSQALHPGNGRVNPKQIQLGEIVEMIHTASLAHDDVLDDAEERRSHPSINRKYGNKFSILVGDFLLARASVQLASLKNHEVTHLLSQMIAELVEGEFIQLKPQHELTMDLYLRKTYLKTASMLRNAARAAALLGDCVSGHVEAATLYGEHLGMAFQITDDLLDYEGTHTGKAPLQDLNSGLVTAPLLFAAESQPQLRSLFARGFNQPHDTELALQLLHQTDGIAKTRQLAEEYSLKAVDALSALPESHSRHALLLLAQKVLTRHH